MLVMNSDENLSNRFKGKTCLETVFNNKILGGTTAMFPNIQSSTYII